MISRYENSSSKLILSMTGLSPWPRASTGTPWPVAPIKGRSTVHEASEDTPQGSPNGHWARELALGPEPSRRHTRGVLML